MEDSTLVGLALGFQTFIVFGSWLALEEREMPVPVKVLLALTGLPFLALIISAYRESQGDPQ